MAVAVRPSQWIEIDQAALIHNLELFRSLLSPGTALAGVVKANAYGHGLAQVAETVAARADWLAVHAAGEARALRELGVARPVLIMGFIPPTELIDLDREQHVMVSTPESLDWLGDYRRRTGISLPVHLKIDTGTKRQGIQAAEIPGMCRRAAKAGLDVVGVATHFANIEDTLDHQFARVQLERFERSVEMMRTQIGSDLRWIHGACSAAALLFREVDFTLTRVGISLYGHWPSRETQLSWILNHPHNELQLEPALTWRALVGQLQRVGRGETVGYGRTWTALRESRLAVIPVGYADGYSRVLGNRSRVIVRGVPAPIVGRVCMNIMMADVTDIPECAVGDEVVLLGRGGEAVVSAEDLAGLSDTINYELLARLSSEIPRVLRPAGAATLVP
jgi:alanine racemase